MILKRKVCILGFLFLMFLTPGISQAQTDYGARLDLGVSRIPNFSIVNFGNVLETTRFSCYGGGYLQHDFKYRLILYTGLNINWINGREFYDSRFGFFVTPPGARVLTEFKTTLTYISVPIMVGFKRKVAHTYKLGFQVSRLKSKYSLDQSIVSPVSFKNSYPNPPIKDNEFGLRFEYSYKIGERWAIYSSFYHSLFTIHDETSNFNRKIQQFTTGVSYSLRSKVTE